MKSGFAAWGTSGDMACAEPGLIFDSTVFLLARRWPPRYITPTDVARVYTCVYSLLLHNSSDLRGLVFTLGLLKAPDLL